MLCLRLSPNLHCRNNAPRVLSSLHWSAWVMASPLNFWEISPAQPFSTPGQGDEQMEQGYQA